MEIRNVGTSDLRVSAVGLGCNNFSRTGTITQTQEASTAVIHAAIDAGITLFDTADVYGSAPGRAEEFMGIALAGKRDGVVLATKFGHDGLPGPVPADAGPKGGARYVRAAIEGSLRRLRTDRIDLLQLHSPDPLTPIAETLAALTDLVHEGKVRAIGHSNFSADQMREADAAASENGFVRFVSAQNEYSLLVRGVEAEVLPAARELGLGFFPFFPLANGLLTGKYSPAGGVHGRVADLKPHLLADAPWSKLDALRRVCDEAGITVVQGAIGWLLAQAPVASVIAGATRPEQIEQNVTAGVRALPADVVARIGDIFA